MGVDRKANTWARVKGQAAYLRDSSVVLPLRPWARASLPLKVRLLDAILRAWEQMRELRRRHESKHYGSAAHLSEVTALPLSHSHSFGMTSAL